MGVSRGRGLRLERGQGRASITPAGSPAAAGRPRAPESSATPDSAASIASASPSCPQPRAAEPRSARPQSGPPRRGSQRVGGRLDLVRGYARGWRWPSPVGRAPALRSGGVLAPFGRSAPRASLRQRLTKAAVPIAQALAACADEAGDPATADQFDFTPSDFAYGAEQEALDRAALTLDAARDADDLADYGPAAAVDALGAALEAFTEAVPSARDQIVTRRPHTAAVDRLVPQIGTLLHDRLMARFAGTRFDDEYRAARTVVDPAAPA